MLEPGKAYWLAPEPNPRPVEPVQKVLQQVQPTWVYFYDGTDCLAERVFEKEEARARYRKDVVEYLAKLNEEFTRWLAKLEECVDVRP